VQNTLSGVTVFMAKKNRSEMNNYIKSLGSKLILCPEFTQENIDKIKQFSNCKSQAIVIIGLSKILNLIRSSKILQFGITQFHIVILTSKKCSNIQEIKQYCTLTKNASQNEIMGSFSNLLKAQAMWRKVLEGSIFNSFANVRKSVERNSRRFLVADDNEFVRNAASKQLRLKYKFCTVVECENGKLAYEKIKKDHDKFDIVLIDYNMPIMDGIEAARKIREYEHEYKLSKIIIICIF